MYKFFLLLHASISILLTPNTELRYNSLYYILNCFVENTAMFYGETFVAYNFHSLVRLSKDVENQDCSLN